MPGRNISIAKAVSTIADTEKNYAVWHFVLSGR